MTQPVLVTCGKCEREGGKAILYTNRLTCVCLKAKTGHWFCVNRKKMMACVVRHVRFVVLQCVCFFVYKS
jgi:hypothetical protein